MKTKIRVNMKPVNTILTQLGVDAHGDVQAHLTADINRRITRYMPFRSGALATKLKFIKSPTEIEVVGPYARVMYYGKVMVDPQTGRAGFLTPNGWRSRRGVPKVVSSRDIEYDTTKNPQAGPYWDRRLMAAEGAQIAADLQRYIDGRKK